MTAWPKPELRAIAEADDLHVAPFREDGKTYGTPTWIWSVAVDDCLYARAYNGQDSRWYQAAIRQKGGRITAAGLSREVSFEPVEGPVQERIDEAYRAKYGGSPYSEADDWRAGSLSNGQNRTAPDKRLNPMRGNLPLPPEPRRSRRSQPALPFQSFTQTKTVLENTLIRKPIPA